MAEYTITELHRPGQRVVPWGINDSGTVVGELVVDEVGERQPFVWHPRQGFDVIAPVPGLGGAATAINNAGHVVGWAGPPSLLPDLDTHHGFVWSAGTRPRLLTRGSVPSEAYGINERGDVAGWAGTTSHATVWDQGRRRRDLDPGGRSSRAYDINDSGEVVGWFMPPTADATHAFYHSAATGLLDLQPFADRSEALAVNNAGQVTIVSADELFRGTALVWQAGHAVDLGIEPAIGFPRGFGINDAGVVAGAYPGGDPLSSRALVWDAGLLDDLTFTLGDDRWVLTFATAINNRGQICGTGTLDGEDRAFVLTPVRRRVFDLASLSDVQLTYILFGLIHGEGGLVLPRGGQPVPVPPDNPYLGSLSTDARAAFTGLAISQAAGQLLDHRARGVIQAQALATARDAIGRMLDKGTS